MDRKNNQRLADMEFQLKQAELELKKIQSTTEPIHQPKHKYADGSDSPTWMRRFVGGKVLKKKSLQLAKAESSSSLSSDDSDENDDLPGEQWKAVKKGKWL